MAKRARDSERKLDLIVILVAIVAIVVIVLLGCAGPRSRAGTVDHNRLTAQVEVSPDVAAAMAKIETLEAAITAVKVAMGDLTVGVGGGGDSVTAWIYALIAAAAIFYPAVLRPLRKRFEHSNVGTLKR